MHLDCQNDLLVEDFKEEVRRLYALCNFTLTSYVSLCLLLETCALLYNHAKFSCVWCIRLQQKRHRRYRIPLQCSCYIIFMKSGLPHKPLKTIAKTTFFSGQLAAYSSISKVEWKKIKHSQNMAFLCYTFLSLFSRT